MVLGDTTAGLVDAGDRGLAELVGPAAAAVVTIGVDGTAGLGAGGAAGRLVLLLVPRGGPAELVGVRAGAVPAVGVDGAVRSGGTLSYQAILLSFQDADKTSISPSLSMSIA